MTSCELWSGILNAVSVVRFVWRSVFGAWFNLCISTYDLLPRHLVCSYFSSVYDALSNHFCILTSEIKVGHLSHKVLLRYIAKRVFGVQCLWLQLLAKFVLSFKIFVIRVSICFLQVLIKGHFYLWNPNTFNWNYVIFSSSEI